MTSSNGNIFRVTGPLWGESTGHRRILLTKASDVELWRFLWSAPEQTVERTMIETPVIWEVLVLSMTSLYNGKQGCRSTRQWETSQLNGISSQIKNLGILSGIASETRRSENDNTPQPQDQWTNSPFICQQVGNCKSFTLTHYLADLFAMHRGPRSIPLCIQHHTQLTSLSFQVSRPSHS